MCVHQMGWVSVCACTPEQMEWESVCVYTRTDVGECVCVCVHQDRWGRGECVYECVHSKVCKIESCVNLCRILWARRIEFSEVKNLLNVIFKNGDFSCFP